MSYQYPYDEFNQRPWEGGGFGSLGASAPAGFDEGYYLAKYPDVAAAVATGGFRSGYQHYTMYGQKEGRLPAPPAPVFIATAVDNNWGVMQADPAQEEDLHPIDYPEVPQWQVEELRGYIRNLYTSLLGREPDPGGLEFYFNKMVYNGATRAEVQQAVLNSTEYLARHPGAVPVTPVPTAPPVIAAPPVTTTPPLATTPPVITTPPVTTPPPGTPAEDGNFFEDLIAWAKDNWLLVGGAAAGLYFLSAGSSGGSRKRR